MNQDFLKFNAGFCFRINPKTSEIEYIYYKEELLVSNTNTFSLIEALEDKYKIKKEDTLNKVIRFISNEFANELIFSVNTIEGEKFFKILKVKDGSDYICQLYYQKADTGLYTVIDPLTGAYQKSAIKEMVCNAIEEKKQFFIIILDIDSFKEVNDTFGHLFGDKIIKETINILKESLPDSYIGRIGGDEFLVMTYSSNDYDIVWNTLYSVYNYAKAYHNGVDDKNISYAFSSSIYANEVDTLVSFTCGIARYPFDATNYDDLFTKADRALYRGKRKSKNCFIIYQEDKHKNIDTYYLKRNQINSESSNHSVFQLYQTINSLISRNLTIKENMDAVASHLGHYFSVDRVVMYYFSSDKTAKKVVIWESSNCPQTSEDVFPQNRLIHYYWDKYIINEIVKFSKVTNLRNIDSNFFDILDSQKTKSLLMSYLEFQGTKIGLLRLDYCNQFNDFNENQIKAFKVIAKLLSLYIYKMNEVEIFEGAKKYDTSTGLLEYNYFIDLAREKLSSNNFKYFIGYFTVSNYLEINEEFGYIFLEKVFICFSNILKKHYKNSYITRSNGNRFIVFTSDISSYNEAFDAVFKESNIVKVEDKILNLNIILGYYITDGSENNINSCIDKAFLAYKSIDNSILSNYAMYTDKLKEDSKKLNDLIRHFGVAIENHEFEVYLQPKFNLDTKEICGAEALSRWNFRKEELLMPASFIPYLEKYNLITDLDVYVFEEVCKIIKENERLGIKQVPISINLSRDVKNIFSYISRIEEIREQYDVDFKYLEVEITETLLINNFSIINEAIKKLKDIGFVVSIDDFGSGYSNLSMLANNHFDTLKINRSLTNVKDKNCRIILKTVINLAKKLNINVICEGVENLEQIDFLKNSGCIYAQGFYFDEPIPINEFNLKYGEKK